jgi:hypothetical protein
MWVVRCVFKWDYERYYRTGSSPWFREIKMNRRAFVSINRMRGGHANHKASLNRFNIVSTVECECGDVLQTEEHIFWDCKWYENQRATTMDILSENSKIEYPKSVSYRTLTARRKKICARRLLLHKHSYICYIVASCCTFHSVTISSPSYVQTLLGSTVSHLKFLNF